MTSQEQGLSSESRLIEAQFDHSGSNQLQAFIGRTALLQGERLGAFAPGISPSYYDLYLVRRNALAGNEILGPKQFHVDQFSETTLGGLAVPSGAMPSGAGRSENASYPAQLLYGLEGSNLARFRSALKDLVARAEKAAREEPFGVEYTHRVTLFWADIANLKNFVGASPEVTEIVAELRTARFQFLRKDTPPKVMQALAEAVKLISDAPWLDSALIDRMVEIVEAGGVDSMAQDATRD